MTEIFDLEPEFLNLFERCRADTLTSVERMYALYQAVLHVVTAGIKGDFAECGVWRGGSVMLMALTLLRLGVEDRTIWLYDTFEGMTAPSSLDVQASTGRAASSILADRPPTTEDPFWAIASRAEVEERLRETGYPTERFRLVPGDVARTLPAQAPTQLALLRLDTDWYESTRLELVHLYPRLNAGGVLIVDDYGYWRGARQAVEEYFSEHAPRPLLQRIDYTGRMAVKPSGMAP